MSAFSPDSPLSADPTAADATASASSGSPDVTTTSDSALPSAEALLEHLASRTDDRPPSDLTTEQQVELAVAAALDRKAEETKVLKLAGISDFTDYFLIFSGTNERQVQAIADSIQKTLRKAKVRPLHVEGHRQARWVLMDYGGDMVIHVFHQESRGFYDLERLWSDAPDLTERFLAGDGTKADPADDESTD